MATVLDPIVQSLAERVSRERRYLHMHPELSLHETNTAHFVAENLREAGIPFRANVGGDGRPFYMDAAALKVAGIETLPTTGGTGIIATIEGTHPGKCVILRGDMDALAMQEETGADYASLTPNVMHACGHDVHTAVILNTARVLWARRTEFAGTVKLMFQPGEEGFGGARAMIEDGLMENPHVDAAFALHVDPQVPAGQIAYTPGMANANSDRVFIRVHGKGGHAARPHSAVDSTLVAAHILIALQTLISRETDPTQSAVITIGTLQAGVGAANVIPEFATLFGTVRTLNLEVRDHIRRRIPELASHIAQAMGATAETAYLTGYPAMVNDPAMCELIRRAATPIIGAEKISEKPLGLGGEDFSFVLEKVPGAMMRLGTGNVSRGLTSGVHHPKFDVDEEALPLGVALMTAIAMEYLNGE
ncbi:MAG: M20 metallopeptidase family protein [Thermomicrobiales bacterium]